MKRGNLLHDDPAVVATMLQDLLRDKESLVLVTAGPPCPDYSRLSATSPGREGDSGQLFVRFAEFLQAVECKVQRKFHILVENVVLQKSTDLAWFNRALDATPVLADASSFGMISRPRTWWTRINWRSMTTHPYFKDQQLKWDRVDGLSRLKLGVSKDSPDSFTMPGLSFHEDIRSGKRHLPCLTTPAPSEEGRPAPKRMKGKLSAEVRSRWMEGNRQYAPWMYDNHALVYEANGSGQLLPAELKEQLHHYPAGFTRHDKVSPRDRHRLLGNSWHLGVARFMMALVLLQGFASAQPVAASDIESVMREARGRAIPVAGHVQSFDRVGVKPAFDMDEQWHNSLDIRHPVLQPPVLEEAVEKTMAAILQVGQGLPEYRRRTLTMLHELRDQMQCETETWYKGLEPHVASAYTYDGNKIVQIPMLMRLLRGCGYPDCESLARDLSAGFPLLGELRRSPGWQSRTDDWYEHPICEATFARLNSQHIRARTARNKPDPEWQTMLEEVLSERAQGLIEGPFEAHPSWGFEAVGTSADQSAGLHPLPPGAAYAAFAFSVVQEGADGRRKVRRCEDYRRSYHNATVRAHDKPPRDSIDSYVRVIIAWAALHQQPQVWCQDMLGAYRQYPIENTSHAYMLLQLPHGVSVWRHKVLPFGSAPSVWHFNRCTDALVWLARSLTLVLALH